MLVCGRLTLCDVEKNECGQCGSLTLCDIEKIECG